MKSFKKQLLFLLFLLLSSSAIVSTSFADQQFQRTLIMFEEEIDREIIKANNGHILDELLGINSIVALIPIRDVEALEKIDQIKLVEEDRLLSVQSHLVDWGVAKIGVENGWQHGLTGKGVKVAVIDTGVADHPDLAIKKGVSFVNYTDSFTDDHGHGTHVAGIIAAGRRMLGQKGVAPDIELYAIKALDQLGYGYHSAIIKGINWAIEEGIDLINLSAGGADGSVFLESALKKAYEEHDILIVSAAGNQGKASGVGNTVEYPAKYSSVIAVSAIDRYHQRGEFSAHGSEVEFAAPGVGVRSTYLNGGYQTLTGTSMAAPHVTGLLALLKQAQPSKSAQELREQLASYTIDLGAPGRDSLFGYGAISFPQQLKIELPPLSPPEMVTYEKKTIDEKIVFTLTWQHPEAAHFAIYRDEKKIFEVRDQFTFTEELRTSPVSYEIAAINGDGVESAKAIIYIVTELQKTSNKYSDVTASAWYIHALHHLQQQEIISGYPNGTFQPNRSVTRAELVTMLGRALTIAGEMRETAFPDVPQHLYASGYIQTARELQLISGYPDGSFQPNKAVTREEVAVILAKAFELVKPAQQPFSDVNAKRYSYSAIMRIAGAEVATGYPDGTYRPQQPVTRAELTVFLSRALSN